jgi:hypothetical protein
VEPKKTAPAAASNASPADKTPASSKPAARKKAKTAAAAPKRPRPALKAPAAKTATKKVNKSAFVRGLPSSMTANEVVAKAKASGITLSAAYVYNIRGASKTLAKKRPGRPRSAPARVAPSRAAGSSESSLRRLAVELGVSRMSSASSRRSSPGSE